MAEGLHAIVTGASRGIGKAVAQALAAEGATVIINYNGSAEAAEAVAADIRSQGGMAEAVKCNVADFAESEAFVKETGLVELMKKYGNPLTLYINGYLHDIHEAEDLMIEVFSYLFSKRPPIRDGGFRAYLYKAARHMALRHKSIRRHHFCLDDLTKEPEGGKLVDEVIRTKERNQILHLCMGELHPDYREALYLTYFEGMSYRQVAEVMEKA